MDLSALKNLSAYHASLTDFLGKGKNDTFQIGQDLLATAAGLNTGTTDAASTQGVNITLSDEAQKLLSTTSEGSDNSNLTGIQKGAQDFLMSFFDQSGLDLNNLSEDPLKLIKGLQGVIEGSGATSRDISTDAAEEKYAGGNKKVYTLAGDGTRLRLAIDYTDGKPTKLSVTDITGGQVETADITLQTGSGQDNTLTINRTQRQYQNGHMTNLDNIDPLVVDLY